jgi:hypothetical protein
MSPGFVNGKYMTKCHIFKDVHKHAMFGIFFQARLKKIMEKAISTLL